MTHNSLYPCGSEWRKWDLHIHTPESSLNNGFGNNWDEYVKQLFTRAIENNIAVIGITDYFSIEGYKRLKKDYLTNEQQLKELFDEEQILEINKITVLPNIEFRLNKFVNESRVNFHVVFSDQVPIQDIEENFLRELKFVYQGNPQDQDEKWTLSLYNLKSLGEKLQDQHEVFKRQHPNPLYTGMVNAVVSDEQITSILQAHPSIFKGNYLLITPSDEDLNKVKWDGQGHNSRKTLLQKSDCLFSSNLNTKKWGLGEFNTSVEDFIQEFKSLKPCIWGSDAHNFEELFVKNQERICWIKADPSYEGLKQIMYEPAGRVFIGPRKPDEKKVYNIIEKVRFQDENFTTQYIPINNNLTAIIGGKSTGKSILIKSIARTADFDEYQKRHNSAGIIDKRPVNGFEVVWGDDSISYLDGRTNPTKRIIYIPQSYLNRVVDEGEETTDIDEIIRDVLLQKESFKEWYNSLETRQKDIQRLTEEMVNTLFDNITLYKKKAKEKKESGDTEGIQKQLQKLSDQIKDLQGKSKVSEADIKKFNSTLERIKDDRVRNEVIKRDILKLKSIATITVDMNQSMVQSLSSETLRESITKVANKKKEFYEQDWNMLIEDQISSLREEEKIINLRIQDLQTKIDPIKNNLDKQQALKGLMEENEKEESKLGMIQELDKEIKNILEQVHSNIKKLAVLNTSYYSLFLEVKNQVDLKEFDEELTFEIKTSFKNNFFKKSYIQNCLDGRRTKTNEFNYLTEYSFVSPEEHKEFLIKEIKNILSNNAPRRDGMSAKEATTALLQNWFTHDYKVSYQGDDLNEMSPGKKSFVLLRLLIDLDGSSCPILLDQPEDDLDNRSIYTQVVRFLRNRKISRQIIIVTHNPNLVLGADAEEVVVANQEGEDTKNRSFKFEYVSGSIENSKEEDLKMSEILYKRGIQEHICEILEGGREAFNKRKKKYNF